jgi:hypothetical protein
MLRLEIKERGGRTIIRVDGSLDREGAAELERVCGQADGQLALDLANTTGASREGIAKIIELVDRGAELRNTPPYVALRLDRAKDNPGS